MAETAISVPSVRSERAFFGGMTLLVTAVVLWGFAPSFLLRGLVPLEIHSYLDPPPQPIRWLYILHGLVFTAWVALAAAQVALVASRRTDVHRRLGRVALGLMPAMVALGLAVSSYAALHGFHDVPLPPDGFLAVPVFVLSLFAAFVAAGLVERRTPQAHKRWMLLAMIAVAEAAWTRIAWLNPPDVPPWLSTELVLLVPLAAWDVARLGRPHRVTLWGGGAMVAAYSLRLWVGSTPAWLALVHGVFGNR